MCSPSAPDAPEPTPPPQELKAAGETQTKVNKRRSPKGPMGTVLTGPSGIDIVGGGKTAGNTVLGS